MPETKFEEIQRKSARGIKWQGMAEIFMRLLQFMVTIVLARLLMPKDFGLISVALIFTQLAFAIFDLGFSAALVQKKEVQEKHLSTTFVVNIISAVVFALLVFSLSSAIASYFGYRQLKSILRLMTLIFFFYAFSSVPRVLLMRALRFKRLSSLQAISTIVYGAVGISLAWTGWGVWSIVFASLCEQFILTLLLNMFSFWRIKWKFDKSAFKELAGFGGRVLGTRISAYFNNNIPNFVKGVNKYKTFLMEMTIEGSKIRDGIIKSKEMNKDEREFQIRELILSIKSDEEFPDEKVTKKIDKQNRVYLEKVSQNLHLFLNKIRGKMMKQEKEILSKEEISEIYFAYHSRNFFYSILLDYLKINDLLSRKNRDYLANVIRSLEIQGAFKPIEN